MHPAVRVTSRIVPAHVVRRTFELSICLFLLSITASAQISLREIGSWVGQPRGEVNQIADSGGTIYAAAGSQGVLLFAGTDPVCYQRLDAGFVHGLYVQENLLYTADSGGMKIFDLHAPTGITQLGDFRNWQANNVVVADHSSSGSKIAYLANFSRGLTLVDVTDPNSPFELGRFATADSALDVKVSGNYAFVACSSVGLQVINVSNPTDPRLARTIPIEPGSRSEALEIEGTLLYLGDNYGGSSILSITTPSDPELLSKVTTLSVPYGWKRSGNYPNHLIVSFYGGLKILDISNPRLPKSVKDFYHNLPTRGLITRHHYAYVAATSAGLQLLDLGDFPNPKFAGGDRTGAYSWAVDIRADNLGLLADEYAGVQVMHLGNPANPIRISNIDTLGQAFRAKFHPSAPYALVAEGTRGLGVYDIALTDAPRRAATYPTSGECNALDVEGNTVYLGDTLGGLTILDMSNPSSPQKIGNVTTGNLNAVKKVGNYVYVGTASSGLLIIDVTNPAAPREVGRGATGLPVYDLDIAGSYAYVAGPGLQVFNIATPESPVLIGSNFVGLANSVRVDGNLAYVTVSSGLVRILDISDATNPQSVGEFDTGGRANWVALRNDKLYVANGYRGLSVLEKVIPGAPQFHTVTENVSKRAAGEDVRLGVSAEGEEPIAFEWKKGNVVLQNSAKYEDAETFSLRISDATVADSGDYTLTARNAFGASSITFTLIVQVSPRVTVTTFSPFTLRVDGEPNQRYRLEFSKTLSPPEWSTNTVPLLPFPNNEWMVAPESVLDGFYRAVVE